GGGHLAFLQSKIREGGQKPTRSRSPANHPHLAQTELQIRRNRHPISVFGLLFRMRLFARLLLRAGILPSILRTACHRWPCGFRPLSLRYPWHRQHPSSNSTGSFGKSRRGSSAGCFERRCACASVRAIGGTPP